MIERTQKSTITNNATTNKHKFFPKTKEELKKIIEQQIIKYGNDIDLNDIDVSQITDMSNLFSNSK